MLNDKIKTAISSIQEQINKFDNKANILITIVGIVFALSLGILDVFNNYINIDVPICIQKKLQCLIAFSVLYFIAFCVVMVFLLLVIYPRKKNEGKLSINYYLDVANISDEKIKEMLSANDDEQLDAEIEQIKVNANICKEKHKYLVIAIWLLLPLFTFMFALYLTAIL